MALYSLVPDKHGGIWTLFRQNSMIRNWEKRLEYDTNSDNKGDDGSEEYEESKQHKKISDILP